MTTTSTMIDDEFFYLVLFRAHLNPTAATSVNTRRQTALDPGLPAALITKCGNKYPTFHLSRRLDSKVPSTRTKQRVATTTIRRTNHQTKDPKCESRVSQTAANNFFTFPIFYAERKLLADEGPNLLIMLCLSLLGKTRERKEKEKGHFFLLFRPVSLLTVLTVNLFGLCLHVNLPRFLILLPCLPSIGIYETSVLWDLGPGARPTTPPLANRCVSSTHEYRTSTSPNISGVLWPSGTRSQLTSSAVSLPSSNRT